MKSVARRPGGVAHLTGIFCFRRGSIRTLGLWAALVLGVLSDLYATDVTIGGTVRDRRRGTLVSSALVTITDRSGNILGSTTTDTQGQWQKTIAVTNIGIGGEVPHSFWLGQNYPNPFNPSTKIPFSAERGGKARVAVYNVLGQVLDSREFDLRPGSYAVDFHSSGSAGVLFYSVEMNNIRLTGKMIQLDGGHGRGLGGISQIAPRASFNIMAAQLFDSCKVITSSLVYETDTTTVALRDSVRADILLDTVHDRALVIDLHNDVVEQMAGSAFTYQIADRHTIKHTDIPRLLEGGVDGQVFSVWISPDTAASRYFATTVRFLDTLKAQIARNSVNIGLAQSVGEFNALVSQGKIAGIVVVEGGHSIENSIGNLVSLYQAGVRLMTITWNNSTPWAVAAADSRADQEGLSEFGKQVIRKMDSLGMIIDVSHVGRKTVSDILAVSTNPVIASHSGAYALRAHSRNLTDSQIAAIAQRGGVVGVVFYPPFLTSGSASLETVLQHIDYIRNIGGIDCVALGSDFDGFSSSPPTGLRDVSQFPSLTSALLQRGYSRDDVRKILGGNFMRVFRTVCK